MTYNVESSTLVPLDGAPISAPNDSSDLGSSLGAATYKDRLKRWAIAHVKPEKQLIIIARFRSRSDADGHLQLLQKRYPAERFLVIFDKQKNQEQ